MKGLSALRRLSSATTLVLVAGMFLAPATGAEAATSAAKARQAPTSAPAAPTNVIAIADDKSAVVSWTAPDNGGSPITRYTVTVTPGGATETVTGKPPHTKLKVNGLDNGTTYTFTVTATNADGNSPVSAPSNPVTPSSLPSAPRNVHATPGNGLATVSWDAPADNGGAAITLYTVTASPGGATATTTDTNATVTGLSNGFTYTFTVTATNANGDTSNPSDQSNPVTPAPPATAPSAPDGVVATAGDGFAVVDWTAPDNGGSTITSYTVTASPGVASVRVNGNVTSAKVTGLDNGTTYTFTVVATNAVGSSAASARSNPVTPTAAATPPSAPTNVTATAGDESAVVSWSAPITGAPILSYTVTSSPGGVSKTVSGNPPETSVTIKGLDNGTSYTFTVTAKNAQGVSPGSAASNSVTPAPGPTAPSGVTNVIAIPGDQSVLVTWTAPANGGSAITSYTVTGSPGNISVTVAGTSALITGLTNGTAYTFRVTATNAVGTSPVSDRSDAVVPKPGQGSSAVFLHGDFNGDGRADIAVWRPSNGTWYIRGAAGVQYGAAGDVPVAADFNGDHRSDIAVFRPSTGTWYIRGVAGVRYGAAGDMPVAADFTGDGRADIAVFRPSNGTWYIRGAAGIQYGAAGDMPVAKDFNGDNRADIAVFRPSTGTWYIRGVAGVRYGAAGDMPVAADFNGDGHADIAVFRPSNGTWYIRGVAGIQYGAPGDMPVAADYTGDHRADIAVFRPSNGTWYIRGVAGIQYGAQGDLPV